MSIWRCGPLRLIFGLLVAPFLFGLLYSLRRPEPLKRLTRPVESLSMEAAGPVTVLAVLDVLYAFFLAVQCAALFGGADYLAQVGISYASYARSGFFQLVAVAAVNLAWPGWPALLSARVRGGGSGWCRCWAHSWWRPAA